MLSAAATVLDLLAERGQSLAVAESLTGGLLAAEFVAVPGASRVFRGGVIAYDTAIKASLLGVDTALLAERGAVDPGVAAAMATGACAQLGIGGDNATYALSTTGVAGPDPQDGHAVGTVFVGLCGPFGVSVSALQLAGDRAHIRKQAVDEAVKMLHEHLTTKPNLTAAE